VSRVLLDTGVFVEILRKSEAAETLIRRRWRILLSSVVHSELLRGVDTRTERAYVAHLARNYPPAAPTLGQWERCGQVLARLRRARGYDARGLRGIQNDVLIALAARDHGVPVVTTDRADFERIAEWVRGLTVVPWATDG